MRTKLIFLVLTITTFSCINSTNDRNSEAGKGRIKGKIKEIVNSEFEACEKVNFEMAMKPYFDASYFTYIIDGKTLNYSEFSNGIRNMFNSLESLKITVVNESFAYPGNTTVVYTANCKIAENFKDGHSAVSDPAVILFIFKRIDHNWKIIYGVQSYLKQAEK